MYLDSPFASRAAIIARPKLGIAVEHFGLLLPDGRVAHCTPERGEHISSLEDFLARQPMRVHRELPKETHAVVLENVRTAMRNPRAYHLTENNCESFISRMLDSKEGSPTAKWIAVGVVALLLGLAFAK
jgi:hypothetical protein